MKTVIVEAGTENMHTAINSARKIYHVYEVCHKPGQKELIEILFKIKPGKKNMDYLLLDKPSYNKQFYLKKYKSTFLKRSCLHVMHQKG